VSRRVGGSGQRGDSVQSFHRRLCYSAMWTFEELLEQVLPEAWPEILEKGFVL